ncbi:MAG: FAD-dependent oxidoreductase [Candidatus Hinthialibacter antarcticus]|nr:FAD-dependent oxidoreductase [Candidatus Hinthialibacter antarcticus]
MNAAKQRKIVVIGAVAGGAKSAAKARRQDPYAEITIYTDEEYISYAGCGEPYYIADEIKDKKQLLARTPEQFDENMDIQVHTSHRVTKIDPKKKVVVVKALKENKEFEAPYDALVIATGARPFIPPIPGRELPGVYQLRTIPDTLAIREKVDSGTVKRAVVVGGGYIGLEMVESLTARGIQVTVIERLPQLAPPYDEDVAKHINNELLKHGIGVRLNESVEEIIGSPETGVRAVKAGGEIIETDLVLLSVGIRPNVELAKDAGILTGPTGAIQVDKRMETSITDIFAAGDCAETFHQITEKPVWIALGSTANKMGRIVGINITGGNAKFAGVLGTSIFRVFGLNVAGTGLIERDAIKEGYDIEVAVVPGGDRPHYMPDAKRVIIKLIASKSNRRVLGAQVWGDGKVDKTIDTIATAIQFKATVDDLQQLDLAYAPPFAPALGNPIVAANVLMNKLDGSTEGVLPGKVIEQKEAKDDFVFLDVRGPKIMKEVCFEDCENIPMKDLRKRCEELPRDKEIITSCNIGLNAALAYRVLKSNGFEKIKYMDGGITAFPEPKRGPAAE